jgi:hypothetical protein
MSLAAQFDLCLATKIILNTLAKRFEGVKEGTREREAGVVEGSETKNWPEFTFCRTVLATVLFQQHCTYTDNSVTTVPNCANNRVHSFMYSLSQFSETNTYTRMHKKPCNTYNSVTCYRLAPVDL